MFRRAPRAAESWLCLPAASMLQRQLGSSEVVYPHPQHRSSSQIPSLWLSKGSSCCLSRQLGAVENPSPSAPCTTEKWDHSPALHLLFPLPAVLVAWGIHWVSLSNHSPSWGAGRCSVPCSPSYPREGQVRSGLLCSMLLTKIFFSIGGKFFFLSFCRNKQCELATSVSQP